jgi:hypothetical protein
MWISSPSKTVYGTEERVTQPNRPLGYRVEHRLEIRGRSADDIQDLAGRRLLLQRLRQRVLEVCI